MNYCIFVVSPLLEDPDAWGNIKSNLFITFGKIGFVIGLILLLIPCMVWPGNLIRKFLSC